MESTTVHAPPGAEGNREQHMAQLDGLRAIAAGAVLLQHSYPIPGFSAGMAGVKLFFVLSGFLITGILVRERDRMHAQGLAAWRVMAVFYARRFLRIFPLYYAALLIAVLFQFPNIGESLPWHAAYVTNYLVARQGDFIHGMTLAHFWSLGVEEQFYLLWPTIVLLIPRRWLGAALVSLTALGPLCRLGLLLVGYNLVTAKVVTPSCFDSLGLGGLLAVLWHGRHLAASWRRFANVCLVTGALALVLLRLGPMYWHGYTAQLVLEDSALSLVCVWLIAGAARGFGGLGRLILGSRPLVYLGTISYGIYVYQGVVPRVLTAVGWGFPKDHTIAAVVALPAVTITAAALSWHLFEKPLNNLKRFVPYALSGRREAVGRNAAQFGKESPLRAAEAS